MAVRAVVLLAIVSLAAVSPTLRRRPRRCGAVALAALSLWWLWLDGSMEGGVLLELTSHHGVTVADMVAVGGLAAAIFAWWRPTA